MRTLRNITVLFIVAVTLLVFSACPAIHPVNDTTDPDLSILFRQNGPAILLAHSDPQRQPTALGCPEGTFWAGNNTNSFFLDLPQVVGLTIVSEDQGGVRDMSIKLSGSVSLEDGDVTEVSALNNTDADIEITQINPAEVVIDIVFRNLRTAQIVTMQVATNAEALLVTAETSDFNNNATALPMGNSGQTDHGGQIIDIGVCN